MLALLLLLAVAPLPEAVSVQATGTVSPPAALAFTGYVVDQAEMLTVAERRRLSARLGRFQRTTRHQIAVVTVSSLGGEDVATFTTRLGNRWGVGRRSFDDGAIILVAPHEHGVRISVGSGLESLLPDEVCQAIMDTRIMPAFRQGRFGEGIEAGVAAIIDRLAASERAGSDISG